MTNALEVASTLLLNHYALAYLILAFALLIQGELTILFAMYLVSIGQIELATFLTVAFLTLMTGEVAVFFCGRKLRNTKFGERVMSKIPWNAQIQKLLSGHTARSAILAKFMWVSRFLVLWIGWSRMDFGKFIKASVMSVSLWFSIISITSYLIVISLGLLGENRLIRKIELGFLAAALIIFGTEYLLRRVLRHSATTK